MIGIKTLIEWKEKWSWQKQTEVLLQVFLFTFPWQLQVLLYKSSYFSGQYNPFLGLYLCFSEVLLALIFFSYVGKCLVDTNPASLKVQKLTDKFVWFLLILSGLVVLNLMSVFVARDSWLSFGSVFRVMEVIALLVVLVDLSWEQKKLWRWFWYGALFQAILGILQFWRQSSLGLSWLGESTLGPEVLNIAKIEWQGQTWIRAAGTFSHANILGGYLFVAISSLIVMAKGKIGNILPLLSLFFVALLLSFSRSAWLALLVFSLIYFGQIGWKKINWRYALLLWVGVLFVVVLLNFGGLLWSRIIQLFDQSWSERVQFADWSLQIIKNNPLGVGRGNFVLNVVENGGAGNVAPWLFQPVHNIYLLLISELGWLAGLWQLILGVFLALLIYKEKLWKESAVLAGLLVIGMFDHYLLTSWEGNILWISAILILFGGRSVKNLPVSGEKNAS